MLDKYRDQPLVQVLRALSLARLSRAPEAHQVGVHPVLCLQHSAFARTGTFMSSVLSIDRGDAGVSAECALSAAGL